ncbi:polysaccharide deacetylase family protein [Natranaerofaba carboxydovora]|uniref:polysaccharide deacetylase family protein n=1 Tax=Natranaerofaba carboxydovora TaxID=2742683 RepID=UPI001F1374F7|nr:polysaccharide deacetylase family protein [Natranaerofaba carboxydovora]UMZ74580.1 Polysaccharide deacetylase [Natranaerofaba carboxydovora]
MRKNLSSMLLITLVLTLFVTPLILSGCGDEPAVEDEKTDEKEQKESKEQEEKETDEKEQDKEHEKEKEEEIEEIDYEKVQPNELGEIMILMYHDVGDELGDWKTTREDFRDDMERLYEKDYRLVDLMDVVNGEIDIPAGTTPVVLTFDDGHTGQFDVIEENGEKIVDPDSAAGIILELSEEYDDFTVAGNFYINSYPEPFGDRDNLGEKLEVLTDHGFSVGNHGYAHARLDHLDTSEEVQEELGKMQKKVKEAFDGYKFDSLALAYGQWPSEELKEYVFSGEYDGATYEHKAVLNVAYFPEVSPFHEDFDPLDLERVKANDGVDQEMDRWLDTYEESPERRYISDGRTDTIAIPEDNEDKLNEDIIEEYEVITY